MPRRALTMSSMLIYQCGTVQDKQTTQIDMLKSNVNGHTAEHISSILRSVSNIVLCVEAKIRSLGITKCCDNAIMS